jgi:hypothetical protein
MEKGWLVDGLMDAGYGCVHLANPSAIKQYEGLKHSDDKHDAFFLAQLLILGILPQGYIFILKKIVRCAIWHQPRPRCYIHPPTSHKDLIDAG